KHLEAFQTIFHYRVMLGVCPQADTPLQFFHGVDVVHPQGIHVFQQNHVLQFPHQLFTEDLFPCLIDLVGAFLELFHQIGGLQILHFFGGVLEFLGGNHPAHVV